MKKLLLILSLHTISTFAVSLKDYTPYKYEVLFTNPICDLYSYPEALETNDESLVLTKPKNVYCKNSDLEKQYQRENSPHNRIVDFITDKKTKELFLTYLSFSNKDVIEKLCTVLKEGKKVTLIIDENGKDRGGKELFESLTACAGKEGLFRGEFRGGTGSLGYAHNKIIIVNPNSKKEVKLVFSSGNMSSGTSIHHENWHFVTTNINSYFAQAHLCLMNGMLEAGESKKVFADYIQECRSQIKTEEETDIKVFFVPGEGTKAMGAIEKGFEFADTIDMAAHRFSNKDIIKLMISATKSGKKVRFVLDDDIYWGGVLRQSVGLNTGNEVRNANTVRLAGTDIRYMQTNHNSFLLQHNKYLIFNDSVKGAVFTGAGNLTGAAFTKNFENFYYITIPEVALSFNAQYTHVWNDLATSYEKMPREMVMP